MAKAKVRGEGEGEQKVTKGWTFSSLRAKLLL
jgi:hypothetical protein